MSNATQKTTTPSSKPAATTPSKTTKPATDDCPTTEAVAAKAHSAIDGAASKAVDIERKLRSQAASAQETLADKKDEASEQMQQTVAKVESFIKEKPLAAAGIAFAAGILANKLFRS